MNTDLQQYTDGNYKNTETPAPTKTEEPQAELNRRSLPTESRNHCRIRTEPPLAVDFESLKAINPGCEGWLYIEARHQLPGRTGLDNDAYLRHDV